MAEPEDDIDVEVELDELRDKTDIDETAESHDIDPDTLETRLDERIADEEYKEAQPTPRSAAERIRDGIHTGRTAVLPSSDVTTTATVGEVGAENGNIVLTLETDGDAENMVRYDSGGAQINRILQLAGGSVPSDLKQEEIAVKPATGNNSTIVPHVPRNRHVTLPMYLWKRLLLRAGAYKQSAKGSLIRTRTFLLLNGIVTTVASLLILQILPAGIQALPAVTADSGAVLFTVSELLLLLGVAPLILYFLTVVLSLTRLLGRVLVS